MDRAEGLRGYEYSSVHRREHLDRSGTSLSYGEMAGNTRTSVNVWSKSQMSQREKGTERRRLKNWDWDWDWEERDWKGQGM